MQENKLSSPAENKVVNLDSQEFYVLIQEDKDATIIDVRTEMEYQQGHIANAKLIDIYLPNFAQEISKLEKDKSYYLYCRSGSRSYHAGLFMIQNNFSKIYNLENGIIDWTGPLETE